MNNESKIPIVILHGWQKLARDYTLLEEILKKNGYQVFVPNLPGNSEEKLTKPVMTIDDYALWVKEYLENKKIKKAIFICHSFGGRVAAKLAVIYPSFFEKLILTGTPLVKQKLSLKNKILVYLSRFIKKIMLFSLGTESMRKVLYYFIGEWDYIKAPGYIKETFKAVIAENTQEYLHLIKVKTLVLWGHNDTFVPVSVGKKITQLIPIALYKEIPGTHKLPYENPEEFAKEVLSFLNSPASS